MISAVEYSVVEGGKWKPLGSEYKIYTVGIGNGRVFFESMPPDMSLSSYIALRFTDDREWDNMDGWRPQPKAVKHDSGKPRLDLIPVSAQLAEAHVLAFGAQKYGDNNWRAGMKWSRLYAAALRHLLAWADGEILDPESGLPHLAHARCNLGFLLEYAEAHPDLDDVTNRKDLSK